MIHRKKSVRYVNLSFEKPNPKNMQRDLNDTIAGVRAFRNSIVYRRARAEALRLMGIPDLHTKKFVRKERRAVKTILRVVESASQFIYESALAGHNGVWAYANKKQLDEINHKISVANQYRLQNPLLLMLMPELNEIDIEELKSIDNFYLVDNGMLMKGEDNSEPMGYNKKDMDKQGLVIRKRNVIGCRNCGFGEWCV